MRGDRDHHRAACRVLMRDDVDTDQIIPKQFLKRVERTGFGEFLFYDWAKEAGWDLPVQPGPRRRPQLRLRLQPRARAVGAGGLRLPRDRRAELRRHLPARTAPRSGCCRSSCPQPSAARSRTPGECQVDLAAPGGPLAGRDRELRHRRRHQAPPAQRPGRHRATLQQVGAIDAYEADRERSGPVDDRVVIGVAGTRCGRRERPQKLRLTQPKVGECHFDESSPASARWRPLPSLRPRPPRRGRAQFIPASRRSPTAHSAPRTSSSPTARPRTSARRPTAPAPARRPPLTAATPASLPERHAGPGDRRRQAGRHGLQLVDPHAGQRRVRSRTPAPTTTWR